MTNFFDKYVGDFSRGAQVAGETARAYADRIINRLDTIIETLRSEEYTEVRRRHNLTLTADVDTFVVQVPANEAWELEVLGILDTASVTINESGNFRFAKQFGTADTLNPRLVFHGGNDIRIVATGNTVPVEVYLQFKARRLKSQHLAKFAGEIVNHPVVNDPRQDAQQEGRHANVGAVNLNGR